MIKTIEIPEEHCINLPQEEMDKMYETYNLYQGRFGVLLKPLSYIKEGTRRKFVLDKGTLVKVKLSRYSGYSVSIRGILDNKFKDFEIIDKSKDDAEEEMKEVLGQTENDITFTNRDIALYCTQKCIDYVEQYVGFAEELDNTCEPLIHHEEIIDTCGDSEFTLIFGIGLDICILFGLFLILSCEHVAWVALGIFTILASLFQLTRLICKMAKSHWHEKRLPTDWAKIDSDIAKIVTAIEGQNAPREIIEQPKLLTGVTNLLTVDPIPTT